MAITRLLRQLADLESATAHCYTALGYSQLASDEYAHCLVLLQHTDSCGEHLAKPKPAKRASWSASSRYSLGMASTLAYKLAVGRSLFDLQEPVRLQTVQAIELGHAAMYALLSLVCTKADRKLVLRLAKDELRHAKLTWQFARLALLAPAALAALFLYDLPKRHAEPRKSKAS